jgi:putative endonuclease
MPLVSGKAYYVYVIWSPRARRFYIGLSENPQGRLAQHNQSGRGWTARHAPWQLVYSECCENYSLAKRRELQLKAQKHGCGFWTLTGLDPARFSLSSLGS